MATWKIEPVNKKSVEEVEIWVKDGQIIRRTTLFRNGAFNIETNDDEPPQGLDASNPSGINMNEYISDNAEEGAELQELWDGCYSDVEYPEDMPEEERERLDELWEEDTYSAWEEDGWDNNDMEYWLHGPLEIEKVD